MLASVARLLGYRADYPYARRSEASRTVDVAHHGTEIALDEYALPGRSPPEPEKRHWGVLAEDPAVPRAKRKKYPKPIYKEYLKWKKSRTKRTP